MLSAAWKLLVSVFCAVLAAGGAPCRTAVVRAACEQRLVETSEGPVRDPALSEISGIGVGRENPEVLWVHNDSGDEARVFAIDREGRTLGSYELEGVTALDWEDLAVGPGPVRGRSYLYLGDIGDNAGTRPEIVVYRVPEPVVIGDGSERTVAGAQALRLRYPDGSHDAEALLVDPQSGELVVITKLFSGTAAGIYRAPGDLDADTPTTLEKVGELAQSVGPLDAVTGADISRDGRTIAVRTYGSVRLWTRDRSETVARALQAKPCTGPVPAERQGEAIALDRDGRGYVTVSEGRAQPLHRFRVP